MNKQPEVTTTTISPPALIQSILVGFETVANNLLLILPAVLLDLLLWLGPHLRLKSLLEPVIASAVDLVRQSTTADMLPLWENVETIWAQFLEQYNLTSLISTIPVGIPSLMVGTAPLQTPYGAPRIVEVGALWQIFFLWLGFTLTGLLIGTVYFAAVARASRKTVSVAGCEPELAGASDRATNPWYIRNLGWQLLQVLALVIFLFVLALAILVPTIIMAAFLALINPFLGQFLMLLVSFSAVWFLVPLIFTPHGIFVCKMNVLYAMAVSARVVRFSLSKTGFFLLAVIILNQGLSIVWMMAKDTSWMMMVGIVGHAFISAALLAASFSFYRGGLAYAQSFRKAPLQSV